jgi:hypothetical protein
MDFIDLLQWPAMVASVTAAWLVASTQARRRNIGFWVFLASNVLWVIWGWSTKAYALIALQVILALMNIRGLKKTGKLQERGQDTA